MSWTCFMIERANPRVGYFTFHKVGDTNKVHRCYVAWLENTEWDDSPNMDEFDGWPATCAECGIELSRGMYSKVGTNSWRKIETGEIRKNLEDWGPGAMWDSTEWSVHQGPDGKCYSVLCPPGEQVDVWGIDEKASSGGYWTRTGVPPMLDVNPSIKTQNYHGYLRNGALTDDVEGKVFS